MDNGKIEEGICGGIRLESDLYEIDASRRDVEALGPSIGVIFCLIRRRIGAYVVGEDDALESHV